MSDLIALIRQRHKLADDTPVAVKALAADFKADGADPYAFTATVSTADVDRDREVLLPLGMQSNEFDQSGAVFWNHDYDRPVAFPTDIGSSDGGVIGKARFMARPDDYEGEWFPDFARAFVTQAAKIGRGVGVSVGFTPVESRKPSKKDRETFGGNVASVVAKWKLLEWSIAPVQANPAALTTAVGKRLISPACVKALFGVDVPEPEPMPATKAIVIADCTFHEPPSVRRPKHVVILVPMPAKPRIVRHLIATDNRAIVKKALAKARGALYA